MASRLLSTAFALLLAVAALAQNLPIRRSSNYDPNSRDGRIDLRAQVDGRVEFFIRGGEIRYRVRSGAEPRDEGSEYRKELPRGELVGLNLDQRDGRNPIRILEEPSRRNNYTLVLEIDDKQGGSDRYHARVTWEDARDFRNPFERGAPPRPERRFSGADAIGVCAEAIGDLLRRDYGGNLSRANLPADGIRAGSPSRRGAEVEGSGDLYFRDGRRAQLRYRCIVDPESGQARDLSYERR